jgi:hypothetical protein
MLPAPIFDLAFYRLPYAQTSKHGFLLAPLISAFLMLTLRPPARAGSSLIG